MGIVYKHKKSGILLGLKVSGKNVSTFYVLDSKRERVKSGSTSSGEPNFKVSVCANMNVELLK